MRTLDDVQRRWTSLFSTSIGVDLRQALRDGDGFDPCEDGLRSVCWKAFLLYGPLSQRSWPKKLGESRSAYTSLRNHFLRFIDHPNDLHSSADPLADDDNSPWSTLRQDELNREEIFQDVTRCMQDNYFFREPSTQKKLLDILFIYSKLNPDIGYRQGMHELLAPILWVIQQDGIDLMTAVNIDKQAEGIDLMLETLDGKYIEHDAFSLFCAVMQTAKAFYEIGENRDSSPIVERSKKIHEEILAAIDPELATHLTVIGILPQIYSIRWIRLLFGREFEFKEVLRIWDLLFAENLRGDIVDLTCVSMLLRCRWSLVEADYTAAITALTHYSFPPTPEGPQQLVRDATFLDRNRNSGAGATLIQHYTGRRPKTDETSASRSHSGIRNTRTIQHRQSPSPSPGRFASPQRQLEGLFQDVAGGLQKRTEGWNVSKAVRSAVGEVRRNMNNYQTSHSRQPSTDVLYGERKSLDGRAEEIRQVAQHKIEELETRNKLLATMLDDALQSLRTTKLASSETPEDADQSFNMSLARIQFVSVYLNNSDIPIPPEVLTEERTVPRASGETSTTQVETSKSENSTPPTEPSSHSTESQPTVEVEKVDQQPTSSAAPVIKKLVKGDDDDAPAAHKSRPSLMDSSFSFMLGENRHRSSFVTSAAVLPEQRRESESKTRAAQLSNEAKTKAQQARRGSESEDDGFTLTKMRGGGE